MEERKVGRPAKGDDRAERPQRVPVHGQRDILTVYNKDPEYQYRWVKDTHEDGSRVQRFLAAAYEFASPEQHKVGQNFVYKVEDGGSVIRIPEGDNSHLYLMRQPKEFYDEDFEASQNKIDELEKSMFLPDESDGQYGEVRTEGKRSRH